MVGTLKTRKKDFRDRETKQKENDYVKSLIQKEELYEFACKIVFLLIQHSKKIGLPESYVNTILEEYKTGDVLVKLGFSKKNTSTVYNISSLNQFIEWNRERNYTFLQIMSSFYKFQSSNVFVEYCILYDSELQTTFMKTVRQYFKLPESIGFLEFKKSIIEKSYGNWFYLWVITFLQNKKINLMHHHSDADNDYIRKWDTEIEFSKKKNIKRMNLYTLKQKNIKYNQFKQYPKKTIALGSTFMKPRMDGIWFHIMKKYKKEVIAGPSSSAILCYQIIFDITKILPPTQKNKILLLLSMIADYSIYYHSISEILQTYISEAELTPYTLDMNDINYIKKLEKSIS